MSLKINYNLVKSHFWCIKHTMKSNRRIYYLFLYLHSHIYKSILSLDIKKKIQIFSAIEMY